VGPRDELGQAGGPAGQQQYGDFPAARSERVQPGLVGGRVGARGAERSQVRAAAGQLGPGYQQLPGAAGRSGDLVRQVAGECLVVEVA